MGDIVFYAHAGSTNHGCEAIVRSSVDILKELVVLYSMNPESDIKYGLQQIVKEIRWDKDQQINKRTIRGIAAALQTKYTGRIDKTIYSRKKVMLDSVNESDIWFSIGGDNYCYLGTDVLAAENRLIRKCGAKTVLWGCSVNPEVLENPEVADDISKFDLITARESLSYEALKRININTVLVPDPAFTLATEEVSLPDGWVNGKMIGVNASPLILNSSNDSGMIFEAYKLLIQHILCHDDYNIALIPHVVTPHDDDRVVLKRLYDIFGGTGRIMLLEDYNCSQIKGFISRCELFIGARTHATIAAYSSGVPTLVVGYSVKSRGIAKDIFGTCEGYVLPVQEIRHKHELIKNYEWLKNNADSIRKHLESVMPEYIKKAYIAKDFFEKLNH